jgi:chaperonin cofactor prefoldin
LATQLTKDVVKDKELIERIVEQKLSFSELTQLLGEYAEQNADIAEVIGQLQGISKTFNEIEIVKSGIETVTDEESGTTVLKATQKINITQAQFDALKKEAATLRNSFIQ